MTITNRPPSVRTWFPDEIENALTAVALANGDLSDAIDTSEMRLYQRGFDAALISLAALFGVNAPGAVQARQTRRS